MLTPAGPEQENAHRASLMAWPEAPPDRTGYGSPVDRASFQRWLDHYVEAWKTYDEEAVGALYSEDARYRYHPWGEADEAVYGRAAIVASWLEDRDDPDSWTAEYEPWAIDGDCAVAIGVTRYLAADRTTVEREYHNVFLCRFDADGRCQEFTEVYQRRD